MNPTTRSAAPGSRRRRFMTAGVVAAGLSIAGAGAAMAGDGDSAEAATPAAEESTMPEGYTAEQYDAFWDTGYSYDDVLALNALWGSEDTETKARAGQMILDGLTVPVAPTGHDDAAEVLAGNQLEAFWDAGYTGEDADALSVLWEKDFLETKTLAGQMILDGQALPIAPTGTPAAP